MTNRFHIMKLGMFCLCLSTVTGSLLSSAQWVCCEDLLWMTLNEIRAHYDGAMLIINLFFPPAHNDQSRYERVPSPRGDALVLVVCCCLASRGRVAARGLGPPYGRHMHPVICSCRDRLLLFLDSDVISSFSCQE